MTVDQLLAAGDIAETTADNRLFTWRAFARWCDQAGVPKADGPLPARTEVVCAYLLARADAGDTRGTLEHRITAIRWSHDSAGLPDPTTDELFTTHVWPQIKRDVAGRRGHGPATPWPFEQFVAFLDRDTRTDRDVRDAATLEVAHRLDVSCQQAALGTVVDRSDGHIALDVDGTVHRLELDATPGQLLAETHDRTGRHLRPLLCAVEGIQIHPDIPPRQLASGRVDNVRSRLPPGGIAGGRVADIDTVRRIIAGWFAPDLHDMRADAAAVLGWAGALRTKELRDAAVADWVHAERRDTGQALLIPQSKTDRDGGGHAVLIPTVAGPIRPVAIVDLWLAAADLEPDDPLLPSMQHRRLQRPLQPFTTTHGLILSLRAAGAPDWISGHSSRRGWVQHALSAGVAEDRVMAHTRHVQLDSLRSYAGRHVAGDTAVPDAVVDRMLRPRSRPTG